MSEGGAKRHWLEYVAVWVALFAAIGSLLGAGASWYQFKASRDQLNSMKFDQRPWVSLDLQPQGPFEKDDNGWAYTFAYDLSNVGRSPAFNVVFTSTMIPMAPPFDAPPPSSGYSYPDPSAAVRRAIKETCQQNDALRARGVGDILFPNSQKNLRWKAHSQISTKGYLPGLAVVACVSYQFSGDPAVHETVRVFDLERRDYGQTIHVDDFGIVPQDLVFFPYPIDGFSAN